jgi:hypothetical protein
MNHSNLKKKRKRLILIYPLNLNFIFRQKKMLPSIKFNDTNSESRYGYSIGGAGMNNGTGAANFAADSSHYYSGVYPNAGGGGHGGHSAYSGASIYGASAYKTYSTANTEQVQSSQAPLTIVDPPHTPSIRSYLLWSVFNLICCGFVCGLASTVMSIRVISLADRRAYKEAQKLSDRIMLANIIITALGALIFIIVFPYVYTAIYPSLPKINY